MSPLSHSTGRSARCTSKLAATHALLAVVAMVANISAQGLWLHAYDSQRPVLISILVGAFVALLVKYVFDKRNTFAFKATSASRDIRTFMMYPLMGVATGASNLRSIIGFTRRRLALQEKQLSWRSVT